MVATSDPLEGQRWGDRMAGYDIAPDLVDVARSGHDSLSGLVSGAVAKRPALFILDNTIGHLGLEKEDSVNGDIAARRLHSQLEPLIAAGCAVVLVAHSNKPGPGTRGQTKGPMGSTAFEGWARHVVHVDRVGNSSLKISTKSNDSAPCEMSIGVSFDEQGIARHRLLERRADSDRRSSTAETHDVRVELAQRIVRDPHLSKLSLRGMETELNGPSASTIQRALSVAGAERVGQRWMIPPLGQ